jgi:hypothetical protein
VSRPACDAAGLALPTLGPASTTQIQADQSAIRRGGRPQDGPRQVHEAFAVGASHPVAA